MNEQDVRARRIQALRETADFLEAHPQIPAPSQSHAFVWNEREFRIMLGSLDGIPHERRADSNWFTVEFALASGIAYEVSMDVPRPKVVLPSEWPEPIRPEEVQP